MEAPSFIKPVFYEQLKTVFQELPTQKIIYPVQKNQNLLERMKIIFTRTPKKRS